MNEQTIEGNWMQLKGKVREQWGKLTDDDVDIIAGKRDQLIGRIKERYGLTADEVDREVKEFESRNLRAD
ncbi:MAG: CsbD family protein [Gemmatimonadaceae bacterium]